eukprot:gene5518-6692_t
MQAVLIFLLLTGATPAHSIGFLERVEKAAKEAWGYGARNFTHWAVRPGLAEFKQNFTAITVFSHQDAVGTNISCFRIPAIVQTSSGTILAFAEARGRFNHPWYNDTCADCSSLGIALKRSVDGGQTWSTLMWAVPPNFGAGAAGPHRNSGGNPVAVWDAQRKRVLLHFVRGVSATGSCLPGNSNWQVASEDEGVTWGPPYDISKFLGNFVGALPGPGSGAVQLGASGRLLFNAHYGTAERSSGAVVVYYSDDGGTTFSMMRFPASFGRMDESTMAETPSGHLVINMRNDPSTSGCPGGASDPSCQVRAVARSKDGGETWSGITFDTALPDSLCQASIGLVANTTIFFNPAMHTMRNLPTLRFSDDGGLTWRKSVMVADSFADYSAIVNGALIRTFEEQLLEYWVYQVSAVTRLK